MVKKINVLLVDDHAVVRAGYKAYLSLSEKIGDIYEADSGEVASQVYSQHNPDVVVMDLSMPGIGGFETIRRMLLRDSSSKILVFSIHNELVYVNRAIKAGVKGYICKSSSPEILVTAVSKIAQGHTFIDPSLVQEFAVFNVTDRGDSERINLLSQREFDVFCLLSSGKSTHQVAEKLCIAYKTACNHSTSIKEKLGVKSLSELTLIATRLGIITNLNS